MISSIPRYLTSYTITNVKLGCITESKYRYLSSTTVKNKRPLSGLQKKVLALYRTLLRASIKKDHIIQNIPTGTRNEPLLKLLLDEGTTTQNTRSQFRSTADSMSNREFERIEYSIRKGEKFLQLLDMEGVNHVSSVGGGNT